MVFFLEKIYWPELSSISETISFGGLKTGLKMLILLTETALRRITFDSPDVNGSPLGSSIVDVYLGILL